MTYAKLGKQWYFLGDDFNGAGEENGIARAGVGMSGRPNRQSALAVAYCLRTGCAPAVAAKRYRVGVRTVQRWLLAAGKSKPSGRPKLVDAKP